MTNFEYIKNMSEKELAQFLMHIRIDSFGTKEIEGELLFTDNDFYMWVEKERRCGGMNWLEIALKMVEQNNDGVKFAPLSNIAGADIKFDKGYGTIKINVPSDVADDLTNGSYKYVGGFLLLDRGTYEKMKGGEG